MMLSHLVDQSSALSGALSGALLAQSWFNPQTAEWTAIALLHFLWQGALLSLLVAILMRVFRDSRSDELRGADGGTPSRATLRYRICCAGLLTMAALPIANYLWVADQFSETYFGFGDTESSPIAATTNEKGVALRQAESAEDAVDARQFRELNGPQVADAPLFWTPLFSTPLFSTSSSSSNIADSLFQSPTLRMIFWGWIMGVVLLSLWHMTTWSISRRLLKDTELASGDVQRLFARSKRRLGMSKKTIELRVSRYAWAPMVVGWFRPVILLPVSVLTALTPHELESILIHELAHVRRHDYTLNLLQVAIETVLFFHPCVWWLSRRIRIEREYRADDVAIQYGAGPEIYVHSLLRIAETCRSQSHVTVAATGGSLADRAARLLGVTTESTRRRHRAGNALLALAIAITVVLAGLATAVSLRAETLPDDPLAESDVQAKENQEAEEAKPEPEPWGAIRGRFVWDGVIPVLPKLRNTKDVVALGESVNDESLMVDPKTRGVRNIAVYVRDKRVAVHPDYKKTEKESKAFTYKGLVSPRVLAVRTTQKLDLLNRNPVAHSGLFDTLSNERKHLLVPPNNKVTLEFPVPELIPVRVVDAIHPWIRATLIVTDHPYVAVTDVDGSFEIRNLPAQEVELQFWHEKTGFLVAKPDWRRGRKKITVRAGEIFDFGDVTVPTAAFGIQAVKEPALIVGTEYVVILDNGRVHQGVLAALNVETIRLLEDDEFIEIDRENVEGIRPRKR